MVYVAARWPSLVREAVLLGCPPGEAPDAVTDALSRCRREWGAVSRDQDVDRLVHEELVAAVSRRPAAPEDTRRTAAEELLVLAPPTLEDLRHQERLRRQRGLRRTARFVVPLVLLASGAAAYYATRPEPEDEPGRQDGLPSAAAAREENPVSGVVWFADGRLHLEHTVLAVDDLRDMTRLGTGVVYGDAEGRVVYAADDGSRTLLGHKDPDVPVAATDETGLAAWYDPSSRKVLVVEAATGKVRVATEVDDAPQVVAVDGDVVYLVGRDGARALLPTGPSSQVPVSPGALLDVRSRIRAFQLDPQTIQVVQSAFNVAFALPGVGADLSPDGVLVATRSPTDASALLYDTRNGAQLDGRLGGGGVVVQVAPGARGLVAYVVQEGETTQLRTCELDDQHCPTIDLLSLDSVPVLAR